MTFQLATWLLLACFAVISVATQRTYSRRKCVELGRQRRLWTKRRP